ncbi:pericentrin-like isoform 1-T1 [Megaptera novaeangliae]
MEEDERERRRRKVEAGRAKLAHFRQRKTKGDCAHSKKTPAKRKGAAVDAPDQEESPIAVAEAGGLLGGRDVGQNTSCSDTPDGAGVPQVCFLFVLATPCGMWDLSSPTRDGTRAPCSGSAAS